MKQNYFLLSVVLGIVVVFNSCNGDEIKTGGIPANSLVYPSIPMEPGILDENGNPVTKIKSNQIVVDLEDLDISHLDGIIPIEVVESCPCGNPNIKLLTLPDSFDVETAVATVRESDDDSRVKADKNFEFGFPTQLEYELISEVITNSSALDLGFSDPLITSMDKTDPVIVIVDTGIFPKAFQNDEITLFKSNQSCDPDTAGRNFVDNNDDISDDIMHGTFVAKRIAKRIKELDISEGTTTKYKILPLKVFSNGRGEYFDVVCAFSYIQQLIENEQVKIPIVNASFGSSLGNLALTDLLVLKKYIDTMSKSTVIVSSAGNEGQDNTQIPHFPSGYNNAISLGSNTINPSNNIVAVAGYVGDVGQIQLAPKTSAGPQIGSNFGAINVDLAAPWSFPMEEKKENGQTIIVTGLQGTSYSAAYISGDLFHFMTNTSDLTPINPLPDFLNTYYSSNRFKIANIQVIDGKYVE